MRVEGEALARGADVVERHRQRRAQPLGVARELVDDHARRLERDERDAGLAVGDAAVLREPGHGAVSSRRSAKHMPSLPAWPCAARSSTPGRPPPTLRTTSCSARPVVIEARSPWPSTLTPRWKPGRAGDDDHRAGGMRGGEQPVHRERLLADRFDRGEHDRQLRALAARHHRVDGDLLDRRLAAVGRRRRRRRPAGRATCGRASPRRARASAARRAGRRSGRGRAAPRTGPRARRRAARASGSGPRRGRAAPRAARRPRGRACSDAQPGRIAGRPSRSSSTPACAARSSMPVAVEPLDAPALVGAVEQHERRHRIGIQPRRQLEVEVELRDRAEPEPRPPAPRCLRRSDWLSTAHARRVQRRQDLVADRAVVLDEREELRHATDPSGRASAPGASRRRRARPR